jgi:4-amino-4-deoxy-L-arabinose transferase-like glycosyltransferase
VLALLAALGAAVHASFDELVYPVGSDLDYYLHYMRTVGEGGLGAFPGLFREWLSRPEHWLYPTPSRVGFILVSAAWAKVFGATPEALSLLSLVSFLALIALVFAAAERGLGPVRALLIALLVAFSPLYLGLARLALTDSFMCASQAALVWLFLGYVRAPESRARALGAGAAFLVAILSKEIAVLLAVPLLLHAALERWYARRVLPIARTLAVFVVPGLLCVLVWWLAAGDARTLLRTLHIVLTSPASNEYALAYGSGGWYRYPIDELLMSPLPTALGLAGVAVTLWRWRRGEYDALAVAFALVYVCQVALLAPFTKNLRYGAVLDVPLRVLAALLLWDLCGAARHRAGRLAAVLGVALLCTLGWRDYQLFWRQAGVYDPVTAVLAGVRGLVPLDPNARVPVDER